MNGDKLGEAPASTDAKLCAEGVAWLRQLTIVVSATILCGGEGRSCSNEMVVEGNGYWGVPRHMIRRSDETREAEDLV